MSNLHKHQDIDLESGSFDNGGGSTDGGGGRLLSEAKVRVAENNNGGNNGDKHERRESGVSECSVEIVDLEKVKLHLGRRERDCRICHLSMDAANQDSGIPIELGCSCKDDLAAAHEHCAEAWFKIKGNKTCEICGSIAQNVGGGGNEAEPVDRRNEAAAVAAESRNIWRGHRILNFLLACMVLAFVISWLCHFYTPS